MTDVSTHDKRLASNACGHLWPPPTNGMTADELIEQRDIAIAYKEHLAQLIVERCGKEGHIWDNPEGRYELHTEGGVWVEADPNVFCDHAHWSGGQDIAYYVRRCTRCGWAEKEKSKESSPFVTEKRRSANDS